MTAGQRRAAAALAAAPLGVATLFVPGLAAGYGDRAALGGWLIHLVGGGLLMTAAAGVDGATGVGDLAARWFGRTGRAVVAGWYAVGTVAGQAVVALVAGGYLGIALGVDSELAGLVALAAAAIVAGRRPGRVRCSRQLRWWPVAGLLAVLGAAALLLAVREPAVATVPAGPAGSVPQAAFVLLFALVGVESAIRAGPGAVPGGWALAALGFLLAVTAARDADRELGLLALAGSPADRAVALAAAVLAGTYLVRNLGAATAQARIALPAAGTGRLLPLLIAGAAGTGLAAAAAGALRPVDVLAVPCAMALAIFLLLAGAAAVAARHWTSRVAGAAAAGLYATLLPAAGAALLWPLAVAAIPLSRSLLTARRGRDAEEPTCGTPPGRIDPQAFDALERRIEGGRRTDPHHRSRGSPRPGPT